MLERFLGRKRKAGGKTPDSSGALPSPAQVLKSADAKLRSAAAAHPDAPPEVLFVLAADPSADVRRNVAGNSRTPSVVSPLLAKDDDIDVRSVLLTRLVKLLPGLSPQQHGELYEQTVKALETLAQDQVQQIREALANTLKDVAYAPLSVVRCLAQDVEQTVAEPVLRLCASLTDDDLLEVITRQPGPWALAAIATRKKVSANVSTAIVDTGDIMAGGILIDNAGAVLEDRVLERMVNESMQVLDWQVKLASRPNLPSRLAVRLAEFVDQTVMGLLEKRRDFDADTRREVVKVTRRRLEYAEEAKARLSPKDRAASDQAKGKLTEQKIMDAISWNDRDFVVAAVALMAKVPDDIAGAILDAKNGKAVTALAWKAGLSMRAAMQLQARIANIPGRDLINAKGGSAYPLSEHDMLWQLEFAGAIKGNR
jgi:uncharacterized protein (DUF2336 family)